MLMCYRTSADLFKTAFDLMVSVTLFVGRFDMRMMQVQFHILFHHGRYIPYSFMCDTVVVCFLAPSLVPFSES